MASTDTLYRVRFELPELIEQGRTNTLKCRVYSATSGALAAPNNGTVSVYDSSNTALIDAAAVTVTNSVATYSLLAATVANATRGDGWRVEWALTMPDGVVHTFRTDAALVRRLLYPSWQEADLYRRCSAINPDNAGVIHSGTSFSDKIDAAFLEMERWLVSRGNRPNLIISPSALYDWGVLLTLALIFEDFASRPPANNAYADTARMYREQAANARGAITFVYDETDAGSRTTSARRSAQPSYWLCSRGGPQWP